MCTTVCAGVENMRHYEAYERALEGALNLTLRYLKFIFLGPPRSGKTSTRRRLVQEIVNLRSVGQPSKSTGVAESNDVIIKKLVSESTAIVNSKWQSLKKSKEGGNIGTLGPGNEGDLRYLAQWFYQLISAGTISASNSETVSTSILPESKQSASEGEAPVSADGDASFATSRLTRRRGTLIRSKSRAKTNTLNDSEEMEIDGAFKKLTTILQSDSPEELQQLLHELTMINMIDVGGQPALLEMLPALTIGPALYFLFFRLDQELRKRYQVRFHAADSKLETALESSYCIEDTLYQSLSSIACFGCYSQKEQLSSGVLLFGTYKDKVDDGHVSQIGSTLQERLLRTKFYEEGLLLKTSKGNLFFSVDNMDGDESEMLEIRTDIEEIVKKHFSATPIPASWLMFRVILHLLHKPTLTLTQCEAIASRLSMPTSVQEALWFFHHNIGSLMYYSDIPSMRDTVICDPQVIFDSVSELIIDRFQYSNRALSSREVDEFHQKGQFSLEQIKDKTEHQWSMHLKLEQLVDMLKDLNILAEIKLEQESPPVSQSLPKFIMPAVLKYASEEELLMPPLAGLEDQACPLMIQFKSGFVPFGVFCASIAHLIAHQDSMSPKWRLCENQVMKNKVSFSVDQAFFATLISRDQYFEIHISRHPRTRSKTPLHIICSTVRQTVVRTIQTIISKMKYKPYVNIDTPLFSSEQPFDVAFTCCLDDSHSNHLMRVVEDADGHYAECLKEELEIDLNDEHQVWFSKVRLYMTL